MNGVVPPAIVVSEYDGSPTEPEPNAARIGSEEVSARVSTMTRSAGPGR